MVLILSAPDDFSTNDVIDWLLFLNKKFIRISSDDKIQFKKIEITNNSLDFILVINNNIELKFSEISKFWYRRSVFTHFYKILEENIFLSSSVNYHLRQEGALLLELFVKTIKKKSLNIPIDNFLNKLEVLKEASEIGLKIPKTLISSNKSEIKQFYINNNKNVITKNISAGVFLLEDNHLLSTITRRVDEKIIENLPENFNYILLQEEVKKLFELRIFFLEDKFYASAIFSQNDEMTEVDFRNYNHEKPNRTPPFTLPSEIEDKLLILMKKLQLNSGSIDMMYSMDNKYYFLEVNPIGQFSQVSRPCNYNIEKKIAEFL